ncbi:MAG TPA: hypothetical protein VK868_16710, partial [Pyrinomonadaceae bacterium]|nr:hypothetical protein [Pyrinomonadaceae bacterium]
MFRRTVGGAAGVARVLLAGVGVAFRAGVGEVVGGLVVRMFAEIDVLLLPYPQITQITQITGAGGRRR